MIIVVSDERSELQGNVAYRRRQEETKKRQQHDELEVDRERGPACSVEAAEGHGRSRSPVCFVFVQPLEARVNTGAMC